MHQKMNVLFFQIFVQKGQFWKEKRKISKQIIKFEHSIVFVFSSQKENSLEFFLIILYRGPLPIFY